MKWYRKKEMKNQLIEKLKYIKKNEGCTFEEVKEHLRKVLKIQSNFDENIEQNHKLDIDNKTFSVIDGKLYLNGRSEDIIKSIMSYRKKFYLTLISHNVKDGLHVLATIVTIITGLFIIFNLK